MSYVQTKEHRELIRKREKLEEHQHVPPIRHIIHLIDDYIAKNIEHELLQMEIASLDDKIYCAKEFIKMIQSEHNGKS